MTILGVWVDEIHRMESNVNEEERAKRSLRYKQAVTAANNAVRKSKVKNKNRAANRVARKSRRVNRRHKR